jgi:hypothetical protein
MALGEIWLRRTEAFTIGEVTLAAKNGATRVKDNASRDWRECWRGLSSLGSALALTSRGR